MIPILQPTHIVSTNLDHHGWLPTLNTLVEGSVLMAIRQGPPVGASKCLEQQYQYHSLAEPRPSHQLWSFAPHVRPHETARDRVGKLCHVRALRRSKLREHDTPPVVQFWTRFVPSAPLNRTLRLYYDAPGREGTSPKTNGNLPEVPSLFQPPWV